MQFNKNQREFPSRVHKIITITALRQTPPGVSLAGKDSCSPDLIESCRSYQHFIINMLSDMYDHPLAWGMNAGEYDAFLCGHKENAMKHRNPAKTLELRSKTYNCVHAYMEFLKNIAAAGIPDGESLLIPPADFTNIRTKFDKTLTPKKSSLFNDVPYRTRLDALARVGFIVNENETLHGGDAVITYKQNADIFPAMIELAKSAVNAKTFGGHNFYYTDFRQIFSNYIPGYEDVVQPLSDNQRIVTDEIHELAKAMKLRPSCTTYWKVNYQYKGKFVMCIDTDDITGERSGCVNNFRIRVGGSHDSRYLDKIAAKGDDFVKYFMRHLSYCTACSTSHAGGGFYNIFGRRVRLCCGPAFRILNAVHEDIAYIKQFIEICMEMISLEKDK